MRYVLTLLLLPILAGCEAWGYYGAVEATSVAVTKKTLGDHVVSLASGKNCSTVRQQNDLSYCVEDERQPVHELWCYPTLGDVTCYDRPDPRREPYDRVGINAQNAVAKPR